MTQCMRIWEVVNDYLALLQKSKIAVKKRWQQKCSLIFAVTIVCDEC